MHHHRALLLLLLLPLFSSFALHCIGLFDYSLLALVNTYTYIHDQYYQYVLKSYFALTLGLWLSVTAAVANIYVVTNVYVD